MSNVHCPMFHEADTEFQEGSWIYLPTSGNGYHVKNREEKKNKGMQRNICNYL